MKASTTCQEPLKLYRTDISPYQARNFVALEQASLIEHGFDWATTIDDADILITNTHTNLTKINAANLPLLKLIIHPNSGYDNFDVTEVKSLKCPIIIGSRVRSSSVTNYIVASLFHALGMPKWQNHWDKDRQWNRRSLENMSIQLIGFGHIGKTLETSLRPLCGEIFIYDPFKNLHDFRLERVDAVIFACSSNKKNHHFFNQEKLKLLKDDCIIINAARGKLINQADLIKWLGENPNALAYLDVFEEEPTDLSVFPPNARCSSHIAGVDHQLDQRIITFVSNVANDFKLLNNSDFTHKWHDAILSNRIVDDHFI